MPCFEQGLRATAFGCAGDAIGVSANLHAAHIAEVAEIRRDVAATRRSALISIDCRLFGSEIQAWLTEETDFTPLRFA